MIMLLINFSILLKSQVDNHAQSIAIDSEGNVFIAGYTYKLQKDIFIMKFSSDLSKLLKTLIINSPGNEIPFSIAIDENNNVLLAGITDRSEEFLKEYKKIKHGILGSNDGFIIKISNNLDSIYKVAIIGSNLSDEIHVIKVSKYGIFVGGFTFNSSQFPNTIYYGKGGEVDAFIIKLSKNLDTLYRTAIITSTSSETIDDIELDKDGNVFAIGTLNSVFAEFSENRIIYGSPVFEDVFIIKLSNDLSKLYKTAILGSSLYDCCSSIVIDNNNEVFVSGITYNSSDFAINRIYYGETGNSDIFISKLSNNLDTLYKTAIISSKGKEPYIFGIYLVNNDLVLAFVSDDYKNVGGNVKKELCGNAGLYDILIGYISENLDSLKKILVLTGNANDDGCYYRGKCLAKFSDKIFVISKISDLFDISSYNFKDIYGDGNYNTGIFSSSCLKRR